MGFSLTAFPAKAGILSNKLKISLLSQGMQFFFIVLFIFLSNAAHAQQPLTYYTPETRREKQAILLNDNKGFIAKADLNNDLIDEYIVRDCEGTDFCQHFIIAFKEFKPIKIGEFNAHKIVVSDKKTYGIQQLIVYNQQYNDFAFNTAIWNPFNFSYEFQ